MTDGEKIIARAEVLHWLIARWTFHHEDWIGGWQAQNAMADIGIAITHEEAMDLVMDMGAEGLLIKPQPGAPVTWRLPSPLRLRRLIAHKPTTGTRSRAFLDHCRNLIAENAPQTHQTHQDSA